MATPKVRLLFLSLVILLTACARTNSVQQTAEGASTPLPGVTATFSSPSATPESSPTLSVEATPSPHPSQTPTAVSNVIGPPSLPAALLFSEYAGASGFWQPENQSFTRLGGEDVQSSFAVWSPDGKEIAYIATVRKPVVSSEIRIYSLTDKTERVLPGTKLDNTGPGEVLQTLTQLEWSGDGRWLIYEKWGLAAVYDLQKNEMTEYGVMGISQMLGVQNPRPETGLEVGPVSKELNDFILSMWTTEDRLSMWTTDDRIVLIRGSLDKPGIFEKIELPEIAYQDIQSTFYVFRHVAWPGNGDILYVMLIGKKETLIWAYNFPSAKWDVGFKVANLPATMRPFEYMSWSDDGTQAVAFSFNAGSEFGPGLTRLVFIAADESRNLKVTAQREVGGIFPGGWARLDNHLYFTVWLESPEPEVYLISPTDPEVLIPVAAQEGILSGLEVETRRITNGTWRKSVEIGGWQPSR